MGVLTMELEQINKNILTEKQEKRQNKQLKLEYEQILFDKFYKYFKKNQYSIEDSYKYFSYVHNREQIINSMVKNKNDFVFINNIYNKKLKEVYSIFKENKKFIDEQEKQEQLKFLLADLEEIKKQKIQEQKRLVELEKARQEQQKRQQRKNVAINISKFLISLFEHPLILLALIVIGTITWVFIGALGLSFFPALGLSIIVIIFIIGGLLGSV